MIEGDLFHIGCYTASGGGAGEGVTVARRDRTTGALSLVGVAAASESPSFLARHPTLSVLYAVNEVDDGAVSAWAVAPDGGLTPLGGRSTGGASPCHVAVSADGTYAASVNYGGGSVAVHPLGPDGSLGELADVVVHRGRGPDPERQEAPHAHMASWDADGHLRVVDLGVDAVFRYALDRSPTAGPVRLRPVGDPLRTPPGTGPRHLARGRGGSAGWLYLCGELDGTVAAYRLDPGSGEAEEVDRVPASADGGPGQPSEIAVDDSGRFLYVANRGPDTVAAFVLDDGVPRFLAEVSTGGRWPRHFALWDGVIYVANERSHTVAALPVDASTGVPAAGGPVLEVPSPTCVRPPTVPPL